MVKIVGCKKCGLTVTLGSISGLCHYCLDIEYSKQAAQIKRLREVANKIMREHDYQAVLRNFKFCGCDWCEAMRPLLARAAKGGEG